MAHLDEKLVGERFREAAKVWPSVRVSPEAFQAAVQEAVDGGAVSLEGLHASDLYLVLGCLDRQPDAVAAFEHHVMTSIRPSVERAAGDPAAADDALQTTLEKLLLGPPPAAPKCAQYTGRGALVAWVRVVAVREALQTKRRSKRERSADDISMVTGGTSAASFELAVLKDLHAASFRSAVQDALRLLTPEQRTLLRFHVRDGLSIDQLAPMLGIHRATAARRLEKARSDALEHTRTLMRERHGLSEAEAASLCIALGGEVDVSIGRVLSDETSP